MSKAKLKLKKVVMMERLVNRMCDATRAIGVDREEHMLLRDISSLMAQLRHYELHAQDEMDNNDLIANLRDLIGMKERQS